MKVHPDRLKEFANLLHDLAAGYTEANEYVDRYCHGGAVDDPDPNSVSTHGSTGAIAQIAQSVAKTFVDNYHTFIRPGEGQLWNTGSDLWTAAEDYRKQDDADANRMFGVWRNWHAPAGYHDGQTVQWARDIPTYIPGVNGPASSPTRTPAPFTQDDPLRSPPATESSMSKDIAEHSGIVWLFDELFEVCGYSAVATQALTFVIGDYGSTFRNADAWHRVARKFGQIHGVLGTWTPEVMWDWTGLGAEAFDYDMTVRWMPALGAAERIANAYGTILHEYASDWRALYDGLSGLLDKEVGTVKALGKSVLKTLGHSSEIAKYAHELWENIEDYRSKAQEIYDAFQEVQKAAAADRSISPYFSTGNHTLDPLRYNDRTF